LMIVGAEKESVRGRGAEVEENAEGGAVVDPTRVANKPGELRGDVSQVGTSDIG